MHEAPQLIGDAIEATTQAAAWPAGSRGHKLWEVPVCAWMWPPLLTEQDEPPCPAPRTLSEWAGAGPSGLHPASVTCSGDVPIFLEANDLI